MDATESFESALRRIDVNYLASSVFNLTYEELSALIYPRPAYRTFLISKRNGTARRIDEPRSRIKTLQGQALLFLEEFSQDPKPCAHGFTDGRSIVTNAQQHASARTRFLLNIDLEDFFPSISFYRVRGLLEARPFNFSHQVATVLAHLFTLDNALPQGAPSSPLISNLICRSLDRDLMQLARRHRATYTRYADDLSFSFSVRQAEALPSNICSLDSGVVTVGHELQEIVQSQHSFRINPSKSRISSKSSRQEVTGLTINQFPNVKRVFIDKVRGALNAWKKYGYAKAQTRWAEMVEAGGASPYEKRPWKRQTRSSSPPALVNVLWGKLLFLRMVRGESDAIYTRLAERYNTLCDDQRLLDEAFRSSRLPVEPVVRNSGDAEKAVFVLDWFGDYSPRPGVSEVACAQGTAFMYRKDGLLITCDHALSWSGEVEGEFTTVDVGSPHLRDLQFTVSRPGIDKTWPVEVVARDTHRDLAVLRFVGDRPSNRYFASTDSPIKRHQPGILIGFPNWSPGRPADQVRSSVTNTFIRQGLQRLEIDTLIRQGNSGGPFVDELFRVAGVAQQGARQDAGNNECLTVGELDAWLDSQGI